MSRLTCAVVVSALSTCAVSWAAPPQGMPPPSPLLLTPPGQESKLQLRADELSLQPRARRIELRGHVRIELDVIRLQADRLRVELDAKGRPTLLVARGAVRVSVGAGVGQAEELSLWLGSSGRQLELRRQARLRGVGDLPLELEGDRIHLDLPSGKLTVSAARARLGPRPRSER